jgi:DNA-binding XRE family transcriptional regulator
MTLFGYLMKKHKIPAPELAVVAGKSQSTIYSWADGYTVPTIDLAVKYAEYFTKVTGEEVDVKKLFEKYEPND